MFVCYFYATFCEIFRSERSECALVKFINFDWVVRLQGMVTKTKKVKMAVDSNEEKQTRLWVSLEQLQNPKFGKNFCTLKKRFKKHLKNRKEKFTELKRYGELCKR